MTEDEARTKADALQAIIDADNKRIAKLKELIDKASELKAGLQAAIQTADVKLRAKYKDDLATCKADLACLINELNEIYLRHEPELLEGYPVPMPPYYYTGRNVYVSKMLSNLCSDNPQSVVIYGDPGAGKTTFLFKVLHQPCIVARYRKNCFYVNCSGLLTREKVLNAIFQAVKYHYSLNDPLELLTYLKRENNEKSIIVFDDINEALENDRRPVENLITTFSSEHIVIMALSPKSPLGRITFGQKVAWDGIDLAGLERPEAEEVFRRITKGTPEELEEAKDLLNCIFNIGLPLPTVVCLVAKRARNSDHLRDLAVEWTVLKNGQDIVDLAIEFALRNPKLLNDDSLIDKLVTAVKNDGCCDQSAFAGFGIVDKGANKIISLVQDHVWVKFQGRFGDFERKQGFDQGQRKRVVVDNGISLMLKNQAKIDPKVLSTMEQFFKALLAKSDRE